jgi:hypothetical protein
VSTPNLEDEVVRLAARYPQLLKANTRTSCGTFTELVADELYDMDKGWGLLSKQPGQNQYKGHAVDAIIYRPTQQVVDILSAAGAREEGDPRDAGVTWQHQPKRDGNEWMLPVFVEEPGSGVPPVPPPAAVGLIDSRNLSFVIAALQSDIAEALSKIAALEARPTGGALVSARVALRTDNGHYLCAEGGGNGEVHSRRDAVGGWETFTIEPVG